MTVQTEAPFVPSTCECGGDMIVDTQFVGYFGDEPAHEPIGSHCCECGRDVDQIIEEHGSRPVRHSGLWLVRVRRLRGCTMNEIRIRNITWEASPSGLVVKLVADRNIWANSTGDACYGFQSIRATEDAGKFAQRISAIQSLLSVSSDDAAEMAAIDGVRAAVDSNRADVDTRLWPS